MHRIQRELTPEEQVSLIQVLGLVYSQEWACSGCGRAHQPLYFRRKATRGTTKMRCLECWHRDQSG